MGNHALRKQVAQALKEIGGPKLWKKTKYNKSLYSHNASELRRLLFLTKLKPGDVVSQCGNVNHIFDHTKWGRHWNGLAWFRELHFRDSAACGCDIPQPPRSIEEINKLLLEDLNHPYPIRELDMNDEKDIKYKEDLLNGTGVLDSNGCLLNLYRKL